MSYIQHLPGLLAYFQCSVGAAIERKDYRAVEAALNTAIQKRFPHVTVTLVVTDPGVFDVPEGVNFFHKERPIGRLLFMFTHRTLEVQLDIAQRGTTERTFGNLADLFVALNVNPNAVVPGQIPTALIRAFRARGYTRVTVDVVRNGQGLVLGDVHNAVIPTEFSCPVSSVMLDLALGSIERGETPSLSPPKRAYLLTNSSHVALGVVRLPSEADIPNTRHHLWEVYSLHLGPIEITDVADVEALLTWAEGMKR